MSGMSERSRQSWLREPLVHFLGLGVLLFVVYGLFGSVEADDPRPRIEITAADIEGLRRDWTAVWGAEPSKTEVRVMLEEKIREEVLFHAAMAMDLDQDDVILRRRMVQKMEFMFQDVARFADPTESDLADFFTKNHDEYRTPVRISFSHVFLNPDQRGAGVERDAVELLERLREENPTRSPESGDRFLRPHDYADRSQVDVGLLFGEPFARDLFALPTDSWQGPLSSSFGVHLVRINDCTEGKLPDMDDVRDLVRRDYEEERNQEANQAMYASLRDRYLIVIEESSIDPDPLGSAELK